MLSGNLQLVLFVKVLATKAVPVYVAAVQVPKKALPRGPDDLPSSIVPCIWLHCRRPTGSRKQVSIALTCKNEKHYSEAVKRNHDKPAWVKFQADAKCL